MGESEKTDAGADGKGQTDVHCVPTVESVSGVWIHEWVDDAGRPIYYLLLQLTL